MVSKRRKRYRKKFLSAKKYSTRKMLIGNVWRRLRKNVN